MNILLLEDDIILNELISEYLEDLGYSVQSYFDGDTALNSIKENIYDLFLFDVGVPEIDGFELLEYIRGISIKTPAIFITSLNSVKDLERGFGLGCDDYIKKPFDLKELELRIEKIKRTHNIDLDRQESIKDDTIYSYTEKTIYYQEQKIPLAQKESEILEYFLKNKSRVVSLDELLANIWRYDNSPSYATEELI